MHKAMCSQTFLLCYFPTVISLVILVWTPRYSTGALHLAAQRALRRAGVQALGRAPGALMKKGMGDYMSQGNQGRYWGTHGDI